VIAPSFADIFYNNCFKNGILPIVLDDAAVDQLFKEVYADEGYPLKVNLEAAEDRQTQRAKASHSKWMSSASTACSMVWMISA